MLQQQPKDSFLRHALALEYSKAGDDAAAQQLFEELLGDSPDYVGSYYHLGKLLERNSQPEQALAWYVKGMAAAEKAGDRHALGELRGAWEELSY